MDDMILVPRNPTKAMLRAACDAMRKRQAALGEDWFLVSNMIKAAIRWDAMIKAWEEDVAIDNKINNTNLPGKYEDQDGEL